MRHLSYFIREKEKYLGWGIDKTSFPIALLLVSQSIAGLTPWYDLAMESKWLQLFFLENTEGKAF